MYDAVKCIHYNYIEMLIKIGPYWHAHFRYFFKRGWLASSSIYLQFVLSSFIGSTMRSPIRINCVWNVLNICGFFLHEISRSHEITLACRRIADTQRWQLFNCWSVNYIVANSTFSSDPEDTVYHGESLIFLLGVSCGVVLVKWEMNTKLWRDKKWFRLSKRAKRVKIETIIFHYGEITIDGQSSCNKIK